MTELIDERKRWNRTVSAFNDEIEKCPRCGGPLEEIVSYQPDPVGIIYESVCKNPDCPVNN
jgi:hypothetical protein